MSLFLTRACDTPKKGLDSTAPELPALSAEILFTSAVSETKLVDGTMAAMEGIIELTTNCSGAEGDLPTYLARVRDLVDDEG